MCIETYIRTRDTTPGLYKSVFSLISNLSVFAAERRAAAPLLLSTRVCH